MSDNLSAKDPKISAVLDLVDPFFSIDRFGSLMFVPGTPTCLCWLGFVTRSTNEEGVLPHNKFYMAIVEQSSILVKIGCGKILIKISITVQEVLKTRVATTNLLPRT